MKGLSFYFSRLRERAQQTLIDQNLSHSYFWFEPEPLSLPQLQGLLQLQNQVLNLALAEDFNVWFLRLVSTYYYIEVYVSNR